MFESVRKFLRNVRRKKAIERKYPKTQANYSVRGFKKMTARNMHIADVLQDQCYGVTLADGTLANIENRWVRKQLFREKKLFRHDRPKTEKKHG